MSSSEMKKVLKYIKAGSVSKLRHFVRQNDVDLNEIRDAEMRGVLHLAAFLGNAKIMKCLLRCGVDPSLVDAQGNTALHIALDYASELHSETAFLELVLPLKKKCRRVMHLKNKKGETCKERFDQLKDVLRRNLALDHGSSEDDDGYYRNTVGQHNNMRDRNGEHSGGVNGGRHGDEGGQQRREEELEWHEKIAFENSCEDFYFREDSPEIDEHRETYNEWADRIRQEYKAKQTPKAKQPTKQVHEPRDKYYEDLTKKLAGDHEKYLEKMKSETRQKLLLKERKDYEKKCDKVFDQSCDKMLGYWDIPWPCPGNAADMVDKLYVWSEDGDKVKYLKEQRIRWHPDRFLHRCNTRLQVADKEQILELVKQISQGINMLLESL